MEAQRTAMQEQVEGAMGVPAHTHFVLKTRCLQTYSIAIADRYTLHACARPFTHDSSGFIAALESRG